MEIIGALLVLVIIVAAVAAVGGIVFFLLWNDFVVHHLAGTHRVSFGAAILVAWAIGGLTAAGGAGASRS